MDIVSLCPLRTASFAWQAHNGAHALTVIVKATFLLQPGESVLAPEQEAVCEKEQTWDDDPRRSIRVPSDRAPYKPRAEVMLVGHAYAPHREPVRSLVARVIVGEIDKSIEVWCDRGFRIHDNQLLEGPTFAKMPLQWERAAGGPETNNPVGMRFNTAPDRYGMVAIPNLQPPGMYVSQRSDTFTPIGFGPVSATWPGRVPKLGRYAAGFQDPGWEQRPIPADFDARYFMAAPSDQQIAEIGPYERIILENLHQEHARLVTTLPGIRPMAIADRATGERENVLLVADTLWIDTDRRLCCVIWRGRIGLRHAAEAGRIAVWVDGMPIKDPGEAVPRAAEANEDALGATMTLIAPLANKDAPALPFVHGTSRLAEADQQALAAELSRWAAATSDGTGTMFAPMAKPASKALPFSADVDDPEDLAETIPPMPRPAGLSTPLMPVIPSLQPLRFEEVPPIGFFEPSAARALEVEADEPEQTRIAVTPPPMIGPLAKAEMALEKPEVQASEAKAIPPAENKAPAAMEAEEQVIDLSIEETATIAAELAEGKELRATVLEVRNVSTRAWEKTEARWIAAMEEEQGRGRNALRGAYDAAYVKRVEGFRGPITVNEYARVVVSLERRRADTVLDGLKIQRPALMPLIRLWVKKIAQDPALVDQATAAIAGARRQ